MARCDCSLSHKMAAAALVGRCGEVRRLEKRVGRKNAVERRRDAKKQEAESRSRKEERASVRKERTGKKRSCQRRVFSMSQAFPFSYSVSFLLIPCDKRSACVLKREKEDASLLPRWAREVAARGVGMVQVSSSARRPPCLMVNGRRTEVVINATAVFLCARFIILLSSSTTDISLQPKRIVAVSLICWTVIRRQLMLGKNRLAVSTTTASNLCDRKGTRCVHDDMGRICSFSAAAVWFSLSYTALRR